jgi:hypothetical protein
MRLSVEIAETLAFIEENYFPAIARKIFSCFTVIRGGDASYFIM